MKCLIFLTLCYILPSVLLLSCLEDACARELCLAPPDPCPKGYINGPGGACSCCRFCKKIIGEGESCYSGSEIVGFISTTVQCAEGLVCKNNDICAKKCDEE